MDVNVAGIISLLFFYLVILAIGILAAWKVKVKGHENGGLEVSLVAGRDLKTYVGVFTMIATTVGGGYINGTAESIARDGLVWTLAPLGIFIGLCLGGTFYAHKMREQQYMTMLDPFQQKYGSAMVVLIYLASLMGDLLWMASILNALGTTLSVIAGIPLTVAVIVSGGVSILYTVLGSMISVAYTDIVQLLFIVLGLTISLPFIMTNDQVGDFGSSKDAWLGQIETKTAGLWSDLFIAMTLGTIPWQSYFQRVLSMKSARQAQVLSFVAAFGALVIVVPSVLIGIAGTSADWSNTTFGHFPNGTEQLSLMLPLVIHEFTPGAVSICGLGAISAAVMSSVDSSVLATSSMFTFNIYHQIFRPRASKKELRFLHMSAIVLFGSIAIVIALSSSVIYGTFILAADIVFVIIFPQLTAVLYCPSLTNTFGATAGFFLGLLLRLGAGEPLLEMPAWIKFWWYDDVYGQLFPHRTAAMLASFILIIVVARISRFSCVRICRGKVYRLYTQMRKTEILHVEEQHQDAKDSDIGARDERSDSGMSGCGNENIGDGDGTPMSSKRDGEGQKIEMGRLMNGTYRPLSNEDVS